MIMEKPAKLLLMNDRSMKHSKVPPSALGIPYAMDLAHYMMSGTTPFPPTYPLPQMYPPYNFPNAQGPQLLPHPPAPSCDDTPAAAPSAPATNRLLPLSQPFPDIGPWLISLDQHAHRSSPHITFALLGESLLHNGFYRINDLVSAYVTAGELMTLLKTNYGTVVQLLQYAKEDTEAFKAGES